MDILDKIDLDNYIAQLFGLVIENSESKTWWLKI